MRTMTLEQTGKTFPKIQHHGEKRRSLTKVSVDASKLSSINSHMNDLYDRYIGIALDMSPSKPLPLKQCILQRYHTLWTDRHNMSESSLVSVITEVIGLWNCSTIPNKRHKACSYLVKWVVSPYTAAQQPEKTSFHFWEDLNILLGLRPKLCSKLLMLKSELQKLFGKNWSEDYKFFKVQLVNTQTTFMLPSKKLCSGC